VAAYGESEDTILDILGRAGRHEFGGIPGILWRDTDGLVHRNPARPLMRDIDQLPLPARHLLPAGNVVMSDRLAGTDLAMAHVMFSRGCPFPCSFCAAGQSRIQYRSGKSARAELEHLIGAYGIQGFSIVDDNFIVSKAKVADICDQVSGLGLRWSALSRVDTVDPALLAKMAASGCIEVKYGMESGSESLLKAMRKNTTRAKIRAAVHATTDGQYRGSSGANACSDGWNFTPRGPRSAMRATSSAAELLCGSADPIPMNASGYARQASATVSFGTRGRPVAVSASHASRTAFTSRARYRSASSPSDCRCTGDRK
jgi:hypothetical protein